MKRTESQLLYQRRISAANKVKEKGYWLNKLSGEPVKSSFPTPYKREAAEKTAKQAVNRVSFKFSEELSAKLLKLSANSDARLHIILAAGLTLLIHKYTGSEDIIIGTPIYKFKTDMKLINTVLPLRNRLEERITFKQLLMQVKQSLAEANENRNYPIEVLIEQLNMTVVDGDFPLFDVAILVENIHDKEYLGHVNPNIIFSFLRSGDAITGYVEYNPLLYDLTMIEWIIAHFKHLLRAALSDPDVKTADIEILAEEEKKQLLKDFNDNSESYPGDKTIHELFAEQAERTPGRTAVIGRGQWAGGSVCHLSYGELNEKADQLAHVLQHKGVGPDSIAGIMVERSLEMIIGIFGILKAGGAYLSIDPDYPRERIDYMLRDSNTRILLSEVSKGSKVSGGTEVIDLPSLFLEDENEGPIHLTHPTHPTHPTHLCYIIYTSGTTGRPKGVMVEHRSLTAYIYSFLHEFNFGLGDTMLQQASSSFDAFVEEVYPVLLRGGRLALPGKDMVTDIDRLSEFILKNRVNIVDCSPLLLDRLNQPDYLTNFHAVHTFISGGDVLKGEYIDNLLKIGTVYNTYGPTETTVCAAYFKCSKETQGNIPIGKPIANYNVYILDRFNRLLPVGVPGELCISGVGVVRGYLNRPALTAEKFSYKSYRSYRTYISKKIYKTGDLARWLPDGNLEFLGRIDNQVKIRGYRIELGEIESRLLEHQAIAGAVVTSKESEAGDRFLCAYFVGVDGVGRSELKEYLSQTLPDYMIPGYFVRLEKIPLDVNGKVDIKALPKPETGVSRGEYIAPRDEIEEKLVEIWEEVLNINRSLANVSIGIDDNFFELGGHSLKATTLVHRIYQELEINIEIGDVFTYPSIRELGQRIKKSEELAYIEIIPSEEKDYYPLSYAQRRLWVLCQFEEDSTAYNIPAAVTIDGPFDVNAFIQAVQVLAERHESLRTIFTLVEGDPHQKIIRGFKFNLEQVDLRNLNEAEKQENTRQIYLQVANSAFNLEHGPLFRFKSVRLEDEKYLLIYNIHHIISDGWSQGNINNELIILYNTFLERGENPLPPLKLQYKDYSRWHNQLTAVGSFNQSQDYWLEKFKDKPNGIELPLDHARKAIQTFNGGRVPFVIDKEKTQQLYQLSLDEDVTLFMSLLSMLNVFLYKYTGQRDIIIGAPIANRKQPELYPMIGFLVNTLVYRNRVNPEQSFRYLLSSIKQETLACYKYQDYPFDLLVEELELDRDLSQSPLFNVMLAHNNAETGDRSLVMEGVTISGYSHSDDFNMSKFDLIFFMDEAGGQVYTRIEYNSDLFERSSVERMRDNFLALTDDVLARSDVPVSALHILPETESRQVIEAFNDTHCSFPSLTLQELFEQRVEACRDKTAVVSQEHRGWSMDGGAMHITYNELNKKANQLSHFLKEQCGIKPNDAIGVSMERSIDMIVVLLGIIKSGAAYLAVDPTYPQDRVLHVLSDSRSDFLIIDKMRPELFGSYQGRIIDVHCQGDKINEKSTDNPPAVNQPSDTLYINYTSGSTGTPNGAMLSHDCLTNLINWQNENTLIDGSLSCLQFTSINFCVSFQEIMGTLTSGGQLHLIGDLERQDIDYLMDFLSRHQVELLFLPFSYLNFLFNESGRWHQSFSHNLKHITTAGEQLKITAGLKRFLDLNPGLKLHNHYGSTEMHVVTSYTLDASTAEKTPIPPAGKPVSNVSIYILDEQLNPVPVGVWGELFVKGSSEVLGYINNEDLTGEKLVYHPEFSEENNRLYRSGDIGRWLPDGNIELRGRKDFMVKVRGFRIELGEIESKILSIDRVRECVVVVKENNKGEKTLFAYVSVDNISEPEIKRMISNDLPQYMVPQIIILESLPLMPNGKVDRESLPEPQLDMEQEYAAPRDELEKKLAGIWSDVLNIERIGIDDNFFELGGHSLKATLIVSHIHKVLNKRVPLAEVFKAPTIRELAEYIKKMKEHEYESLKPAEKRDFYAVSSAQKRLYILQQMETGESGNTGYNMPIVVILEGNLDKDCFEKTFRKLTARHESLRTSFERVNRVPVQKVYEEVEFEIEYFLTTEGTGERKLMPTISDFIRPFDLSRAPLLRVGLIKVAEESHVLMVDMHHIISDGTSLGIITKEFMTLYAGKELTHLRIQYKDFSLWQNELFSAEKIKEQEEYWLGHFEGEIPTLNLPNDYPRPLIQSFEGSTLTFELGEDDTRALRTLALKEETTLYMLLLSIYNVFLSKISGQEDIIIGTPTAGRRHADLQQIIGMFVNTLALRNYPGGEKPFCEFLKEVKERTLEAFENQEYQFEDLVEKAVVNRDASRNPVFDVMFVLQNLDISEVEIVIPGLKLKPFEYENRTAKFDITLQGYESEKSLMFAIDYSTRLFKQETIQRLINHLLLIIKEVCSNPGTWISEIDILTEAEKHQLLYDFNDTITAYPGDKTIHELFEEQVERTPDGIAFVGARGTVPLPTHHITITYKELNRKSNQLAHVLRDKGVGPDRIVGLMVDRSLEMIMGILGILKAGGAYLPIEPDYPRERVDFMLADSNAVFLLTAHELSDIFKGTACCAPTITPAAHNLYLSLAYIIYTSGTTGKPKGVLTTHYNVTRVVRNSNYIDIKPVDRVLQLSNYAFDGSVFDIYGALLNSAALVMIEREDVLSVERLSEVIKREGITVFFVTTALFNTLVDIDLGCFDSIRKVLFGGERVSVEHSGKILEYLGKNKVIHVYGPTETTVYATYYFMDSIEKTADTIPIGKPLSNTTVYILDKYLTPVPIGVSGELYIGGTGTARGYLNSPELTAGKFLPGFYRSNKSYRSYISKKIYKTGDLARWLADGNIEFIGRIDHQVKIRGFRIELGEIESRLLAHDEIKEAVVLSKEDNRGMPRYLCAYLVSGKELSAAGLREYLSKSLPEYMIPVYFVRMEKIPLTSNGKVDRKALPEPETGRKPGEDYTPPRNELEKQLVDIWSEMLRLPSSINISIDDNFFELGGQSLLAMQMSSRLLDDFHVKIPLVAFFQEGTVRRIAQLIEQLRLEEQPHEVSRFEEDHSLSSLKLEKIKRVKENL